MREVARQRDAPGWSRGPAVVLVFGFGAGARRPLFYPPASRILTPAFSSVSPSLPNQDAAVASAAAPVAAAAVAIRGGIAPDARDDPAGVPSSSRRRAQAADIQVSVFGESVAILNVQESLRARRRGGGGQDTPDHIMSVSAPTKLGSLSTITATGNSWKYVTLPEPITVSNSTILKFTFGFLQEKKRYGICLLESEWVKDGRLDCFYTAGDSVESSLGVDVEPRTEEGQPSTYEIPVGSHFTGEVTYLGFILDSRKGDSTGESSWSNIEIFDPTTPNDPGGHDDPHLHTWKGILYNYHGQCDLIYTTCPSFDNNMGLHIHMRTKFVMPDEWSTITNLAVKIGEDTFELQNDGTYHVNGEVNPALSDTANLAGHEMKQATRQNGHDFSIALGDGISLEVANYVRETRNSLWFKITGVHDHRDNGGTSLSDCVGLTSTWDHPEDHRFLVGRSGTTYSAAQRVDFGPEWQVDRTKGDPMLFAEDAGQQLPDQMCVDSKDDLGHRRLLDDAEAEALGRQAEDACRHLNDQNPDLFEACVSDVLLTGDVSFAEEPWYNAGDEF